MYSFPIMNSTYLLKARKPSLTESGAIGSADSLLPLCDCDGGYLESRPVALLESLERIVPESLHNELDISGWGWVKGLFDEDNGVFEIASREVTSDSVSQRVRSVMSWRNRYIGWSSVIAEAKTVIQAATGAYVTIEISSTMMT